MSENGSIIQCARCSQDMVRKNKFHKYCHICNGIVNREQSKERNYYELRKRNSPVT